jgi:hypothetical protein
VTSPDTADTVEGRRLLDNRFDSVVQFCNAEDRSRVEFGRLPLSIGSVRYARLLILNRKLKKLSSSEA